MTNDDGILDLLHTIYDSFSKGDAAFFEGRFADDAVCIGTDAQEFWTDSASALPVMAAQIKEMSAAGISLAAGDPVVGEAGDVAWVADRPTITLPDGSTQQLRATLVAARENGELTIRQMHLSAPAPNEELVQQTLTL